MNVLKIGKLLTDLLKDMPINEETNRIQAPEARDTIKELFDRSATEWNNLISKYETEPVLDVNIEHVIDKENANVIVQEGARVGVQGAPPGKQDLIRSEKARLKMSSQIDQMIEGGQSLIERYQESINLMEKKFKENETTYKKMSDELFQLKKECLLLNIDKEMLETDLNELHGVTETQKLKNWIEIKEISLTLLSSEKKVNELIKEVDNLKGMKNRFNEKEQALRNTMKSLNVRLRKMEHEKESVFETFEILALHLTDKNAALKNELMNRESLWMRTPSDETLMLQLEIVKDENQVLKEIVEKSQKLNLKQDDHMKRIQQRYHRKDIEHWFLNTKLEGKIKSLEMENAVLRRKLHIAESKLYSNSYDSCCYQEAPRQYQRTSSVQEAEETEVPRYTAGSYFHHTPAIDPFADDSVKMSFDEDQEVDDIPVNMKPNADLKEKNLAENTIFDQLEEEANSYRGVLNISYLHDHNRNFSDDSDEDFNMTPFAELGRNIENKIEENQQSVSEEELFPQCAP